jgi:hypothetical protein
MMGGGVIPAAMSPNRQLSYDQLVCGARAKKGGDVSGVWTDPRNITAL